MEREGTVRVEVRASCLGGGWPGVAVGVERPDGVRSGERAVLQCTRARPGDGHADALDFERKHIFFF